MPAVAVMLVEPAAQALAAEQIGALATVRFWPGSSRRWRKARGSVTPFFHSPLPLSTKKQSVGRIVGLRPVRVPQP